MSELFIVGTTGTPIGSIQVSATQNGICQVGLLGPHPLTGITPEAVNSTSKTCILASLALQQILEFLTGKRTSFEVTLDWSLTSPFQRRVLEITRGIPFGEIRTYGQIAKSLENPQASRAIGGALGRNPIPLIIPCHRVVAANGQLTGFSAADGIRTKQWLLEMEGHKVDHQKLV